MGLFNFIETFFFISLGITFVLILLLVYHFKQRMSSLEEKGDTMFEIINNIVEELTSVKRELLKQTFNEKSFFPSMPSFSLSSVPNVSNVSEQKLEPVIEQENEDEVASEGESESEGDDEDDSESENDESVYEDEVVEADDNIDYYYDEGDDGDEYEDDKDIKVDDYNSSNTDNELNDDPVEAEDVIFQEVFTENGDETSPFLETIVQESIVQESIVEESIVEESIIVQESIVEEPVKIVTLDLDESVSKEEEETKDEEVLDTITTEEPETEYSKEDMDAFKKMTIQQLKTIFLKKGLSLDVGKLKKNELIRILESSYE